MTAEGRLHHKLADGGARSFDFAQDDMREVGAAYRAVMGRHFPAMAVVEVSGLVEAEAKVEIEATAVV